MIQENQNPKTKKRLKKKEIERGHKMDSRKADMSIAMIVAIVIGLTVILVIIFMFTGKTKMFAKAGTCPGDCALCDYGETCEKACPESKPMRGFRHCTVEIGGEEKDGRCCEKI